MRPSTLATFSLIGRFYNHIGIQDPSRIPISWNFSLCCVILASVGFLELFFQEYHGRAAHTHVALHSHTINLREVCESCIIQDGRASRLGKYGWIWSHTFTQPLGLLNIVGRVGDTSFKQEVWASPTCHGWFVPTRLWTGTAYQLVPSGYQDTNKSKDMQHLGCLLNIITTTSPVEISGRGRAVGHASRICLWRNSREDQWFSQWSAREP